MNWLESFTELNLYLYENYSTAFISGVLITLKITAISLTVGALLAVPIAWARMSKNRFISSVAYLYVYVIRSTPLLAQIFLVYAGLGAVLVGYRELFTELGVWRILRDGFYYAVAAFALNSAAYQAEVIRTAITSVSKSQFEAAASLGLSKKTTYLKIIFPQALVSALRPYGNEIILLVKGSSLASLVTVLDLLGVSRLAFSETLNLWVYLWSAVVYIALVEIIRNIWSLIERRANRHLQT